MASCRAFAQVSTAEKLFFTAAQLPRKAFFVRLCVAFADVAGAERVKTREERIKFGGLANAAYDPCYHMACDDIYNVDAEAHKDMAGRLRLAIVANRQLRCGTQPKPEKQ